MTQLTQLTVQKYRIAATTELLKQSFFLGTWENKGLPIFLTPVPYFFNLPYFFYPQN